MGHTSNLCASDVTVPGVLGHLREPHHSLGGTANAFSFFLNMVDSGGKLFSFSKKEVVGQIRLGYSYINP